MKSTDPRPIISSSLILSAMDVLIHKISLSRATTFGLNKKAINYLRLCKDFPISATLIGELLPPEAVPIKFSKGTLK
jgi:hypothetical protein